MAKSPEPVVLELASLPREQLGAFLILGLDKAAETGAILPHWADRVKWARRQQIKVQLEDVNWARDVLGDVEKRIKADAGSLNIDTTDAVLAQMTRRYGVEGGQVTRLWQPLDCEKPLADYIPPVEVPDLEAVRAALTVPDIPEEVPAAASLLRALARQPIDPWAVGLLGADAP